MQFFPSFLKTKWLDFVVGVKDFPNYALRNLYDDKLMSFGERIFFIFIRLRVEVLGDFWLNFIRLITVSIVYWKVAPCVCISVYLRKVSALVMSSLTVDMLYEIPFSVSFWLFWKHLFFLGCYFPKFPLIVY